MDSVTALAFGLQSAMANSPNWMADRWAMGRVRANSLHGPVRPSNMSFKCRPQDHTRTTTPEDDDDPWLETELRSRGTNVIHQLKEVKF